MHCNELVVEVQGIKYNFAALLFLDKGKNEICMYREELCVHEMLHKWSITTGERVYETLLQ
uniref:Uncharacterized protein n=1 Tax=Rhizophora mucronata TaxID=61149 RepID=A0A2P2LR11_RHIMU